MFGPSLGKSGLNELQMTNTPISSPFSAVDATLGYLYQVRSALLWALRRLKSDPNFLVSVETLDDVTFENTAGEATDLLQTKHHRQGTSSLTDASPDLWKTLRIWLEGHASGLIPPNASLYLVTTGIAPAGSAADRLRATNRDISVAKQSLDATASTSTNQTNKVGYEVYLNATSDVRMAVLNRVIIIDASPMTMDLNEELREEVFWAAGKEHHEAFLNRLEGWWFRRVLRQLCHVDQNRIGSAELEAQMSDLREQFKHDALPIDDDLLEFKLDDATAAAHENSVFVRQLEIVKAGKHRVAAAIRDYYRAFEQRSRWLRDDLIVGLDLDKYEKRLSEEWEIVFEAMRDDLGDAATESAKEQAAREVLKWAERTTIPIRPSVTEPFLCRGSLHLLADNMRVGWHPEFRSRLETLLQKIG